MHLGALPLKGLIFLFPKLLGGGGGIKIVGKWGVVKKFQK